MLALFVSIPSISYAQTASPTTLPASLENATPAQAVVIATVNIYDAKIVSQDKNNIIISFDLNNREKAQPGIKYAINLVQKGDGDARTLVDQKVYDEVLSLSENTTITKQITYQAPEYLSGNYEIWVTSQTDKGLPLGQGLAGEVKLTGNNEYINLSDCYLQVQGEAKDKKYALGQGVDVNPEETLLANCTAKSNFKTEQVVSPVFTTYYRDTFGEKIKEEKQENITLKANESKDIVLIIPKAQKPQAYDAVLSLINMQNKSISNVMDFHYVLRGNSATIQNLRLDKDYYKKGDTAKISFYATFSANNFPGSRLGVNTDEKVNLELVINTENKACSDSIRKELDKNAQIDLEALIAINCPNPEVSIFLKDKDGNILDQANLKIASKEVPMAENPIVKVAQNKTAIVIFFSVIALALIIILIALVRKKRLIQP